MTTLRPRHERHRERHRTDRIGWLRAAVLGANDGVISTASLVVGVAAAGTGSADLLVTGIAGLVAGAMSMAAGEYVSVSSLVFLGLLGVVAARAGGSPLLVSAVRVMFWGALAMGLTAGVGSLFGVAA